VGSLALNFARNKDSQIQQALDAARASADPSVRATNYQTVAKRFASDVPYLWIDRSVWVVSAKPNVMNFNGPTFPDGTKGVGLQGGRIWPTQIWVS
jgi:ABC-type transport system substrate-binding protein